ncbi:MAG: TspO/MBR family protein, partial [Hyphomicrobium sp.]
KRRTHDMVGNMKHRSRQRGLAGSGSRDVAGLIAFLAVCLGVMAIGGGITATTVGTWYQTLEKPGFAPPDWIFGPVWASLYIMMAVAGWLVWRRTGVHGPAQALFAAQLALTLGWTALFFGMTWIGGALLEIVILWIVIGATTMAFFSIRKAAGLLFLPYLLWVAYAAVLNGAIWAMNGQPFP